MPGQAPPPPTGTAARPCRRPRAPRPAIVTCPRVLARRHSNFACNSRLAISNFEFISLELQRFQTLLKVHAIELHAILLSAGPVAHGHRSQALPPPTGTAARPCRRPRALRPGRAAAHGHRSQAPRPAIVTCPRVLARRHSNFACNSPISISNFEFKSLELQRFQMLLKVHAIELHAILLSAGPAAHGHCSQDVHAG